MKTRITAVILAAMLSAACLTGCGSTAASSAASASASTSAAASASASQSAAESASASAAASEETVAIANPWVDTDAAGMEAATGISFREPDGAQNIAYSVCDNSMAQMTYTDANGVALCARGEKTADAQDISGAYYTWSDADTCMVGLCEGHVMDAQDADEGAAVRLCTWYDSDAGISYSLTAQAADLTDFDITTAAKAVFVNGDVDDIGTDAGADLLAACGSYTCDYDESTLTIGEDSTVDVSLTRLCDLQGTTSDPENGVMTFTVTDPNGGEMTLEFDTATGVLTVTDSTWDLLPTDSTFTFVRDAQ